MKKVILLTLAILITACSSTTKKEEVIMQNQQNEIQNYLKNKRFYLTEINGEKIPYHYKTNIHFKNNSKKGINFFTSKTPCNRVFGGFNIKNNLLIIENKNSTEMNCAEEYKVKPEMLMQNLYIKPLKVEIIENGFKLSNKNNYMKFKKYHK